MTRPLLPRHWWLAPTLGTLLWVGAAQAGTYGSHTESFAGFTLTANINVGSHGGPDPGRTEGEALERGRESAKRGMRAIEPQLRRMLQHYLTGKHPYRGLQALLAPSSKKLHDEGRWGGRASVEIRLWVGLSSLNLAGTSIAAGDLGSVMMLLHLRPDRAAKVLDALREKLAAEIILAQLHPGGLFSPQPAPDAKLDRGLSEQLMFETELSLERVHTHLKRRKLYQQIVANPKLLLPPSSLPAVVEYTDPQGKLSQISTTIEDGKPLAQQLDPRQYKSPRIVTRNEEYRRRAVVLGLAVAHLWNAILEGQGYGKALHERLLAHATLDPGNPTVLFRLLLQATPVSKQKELAGALGAALAARDFPGRDQVRQLLEAQTLALRDQRALR